MTFLRRWAVLVLVTVTSCGGGGSDDPDEFGLDFDRFDYNAIAILPREAFEQARQTAPADQTVPTSRLRERIRDLATNSQDTPFLVDWNNYVGTGQSIHTIRYFVVYETTWSPSGGCTLRVDIVEGLPWNPARPAVASYEVMVAVGEQHHEGSTISSESECLDEAADRVADAMDMADQFPMGWMRGPPQHAQ